MKNDIGTTDAAFSEKRKPGLREIFSCVIFIGFVGVLFILNVVVPAPDVLVSERRIPASFPALTLDSVMNGTFMNRFEDYASDNFVFRDTFRGTYAFLVFEIYRMNDKSGLYRSDNVGIGEFRRIDTTSFRQTCERLIRAKRVFDGVDMNIYYSLVPDKSVYAEMYLPGFLLDTAEDILLEVLAEYEYIRVADHVRADNFYKTDLHWNQIMISEVTRHLLRSMGAESESGDFPIGFAGQWRGVYSGQLALPLAPDMMNYVDIPNLKVSYLNERTLEFDDGPVYDHARFAGVDPYDFFLRGPQPLIVIENYAAPERSLYLFRDSFGSSLAPLMTGAYSKIYVIDLRYINLSLLENFIDFTPGSDVLFIYSSQIFNNPAILQT